MYIRARVYSKVQARKETPDHVSVQEKCLNSFLSQGINLVGIKKALLYPRVSGVEKAEANRLLHPQAVRRLLRDKKIAYICIHTRARFSVSMAKGGH